MKSIFQRTPIFLACIGFIITVSWPLMAFCNGPFKTGWWTGIEKTSQISQYAADGNSLVLALSGGWFTGSGGRSVIQKFLDTATNNNLKVIVSLVRNDATPNGIPLDEFSATVNAFKNHPALFGWYIADEPEIFKSGMQIPFSYLATTPGYYQLLKSLDPNHPILISFNMIYKPYDTTWGKVSSFLGVTDLVGMHNYPFWSPAQYLAEFSGAEMRTQYDVWKYASEKAKLAGKTGFIATCQGFGYQSNAAIYRDPTFNELRYQAFSAIVLGIDTVLFWYDGWSNDITKNNVKRIIGQIQDIGSEMNAGLTNGQNVNVSIADRNQIVYRYGINGSRHALLAVNIANRIDAAGATLNKVRFTLPSSIRPSNIIVTAENRTLPVGTDNSFTDSFQPFAVHVYTFEIANGTTHQAPTGLKLVEGNPQ
jgi:hypothetical protein